MKFHNFLFKCNFVLERKGSAAISRKGEDLIYFTSHATVINFISTESASKQRNSFKFSTVSVEVSHKNERENCFWNRKTVKRFLINFEMKRKPILPLRLLWQLFHEAAVASRSVVFNGILFVC